LSYQHAPHRRATPSARAHARTAPRVGARDAAAVRAFYEDALHGRQVWPTQRAPAAGGPWFLVAGTLVEVRAARDANDPPIAVEMDAPDECAARCWDAGFEVRVGEPANGAAVLSVIDPFGREIVLARRDAAEGASGTRVREAP
jgi:catechol 2,3-dioxygenase-like lactoylglutathione lyase family enzyme